MPDVTYFKRYRMEVDLTDLPPIPGLPDGFVWLAWADGLLPAHADAKYQSFRDTLDTAIFPNLGHPLGCVDLMRAIRSKADFVPEATWLIAGSVGPCGTIQGVRDRMFGSIQNVGVVPEARGLGLGAALVRQALAGFRRAGLRQAYLEVTAQNTSAVRLYRRLGFRCTRTIYKAVHRPAASPIDLVTI